MKAQKLNLHGRTWAVQTSVICYCCQELLLVQGIIYTVSFALGFLYQTLNSYGMLLHLFIYCFPASIFSIKEIHVSIRFWDQSPQSHAISEVSFPSCFICFSFFPLVCISILTGISKEGIILSPSINFQKLLNLPFLNAGIRIFLHS